MTKVKFLYVAAAGMLSAPASIALPGCAVDPSEAEVLVAPGAGEVTEEHTDEAQSAVDDCSSFECGNCVLHARCLMPSLPYGLVDCATKDAIINAGQPKVGRMAIMHVGPYCHVGYVRRVDGAGDSATIWLDEANYPAGVCRTDRHGTASDLKIVGYFK